MEKISPVEAQRMKEIKERDITWSTLASGPTLEVSKNGIGLSDYTTVRFWISVLELQKLKLIGTLERLASAILLTYQNTEEPSIHCYIGT